MQLLYFDCFAGISGDMCLGALVDAGVNFNDLKEELFKLDLDEFEIKYEKVKRNGISATNIIVEMAKKKLKYRHLPQIEEIIDRSNLSKNIKEKSKHIFNRLAEAEANVHGTSKEKVHFHEVGAVDTIVDIVGTVIALEYMEIDKVISSPLPLGKGFVRCEHGILPVPAPATLELLKGVPVTLFSKIEEEAVTPTGAAIITSLAESYGFPGVLVIDEIGYGAGKKDCEIPNLLRVIKGHTI